MQTFCDLSQFNILYQDDQLVAIHKPAGLLVHPSPIDKRETQFAVHLLADQIKKKVYPVHRLDKATSGLLVFALSKEVARSLSEAWQKQQVHKTYIALCRGWLPDSGEIDQSLKYETDKFDAKSERMQTAQTQFQTLATTLLDQPLGRYSQQRYSLVQLNPKTGRKHQIRRHLNHIAHPIIGDVKHGDRHHNHLFNDWLGQHRLYLAATQLILPHPQTQQLLTIKAPLENSFQRALNALNLDDTL